MPILPSRPRRYRDRLRAVSAYLDYFTHGGAFLGLSVAFLAILLWVLKVELQYVAGAFLIVHGTTLARKRVAPTVVQPQPEPPRPTPLRQILRDQPKDSVVG